MFDRYLVTGATGYLGSTVVRRLTQEGARVRALVMPGDPLAQELPDGVEISEGYVDKPETLSSFFDRAGMRTCVIHCAGIVSITSRANAALERVNVEGTRAVLALSSAHAVSKLIYVSSVHAIPERPAGEIIRECAQFSPRDVVGAYAKTKSAATALVLCAARNGLNATVVHPSGIIGPNDRGSGPVTGAIISYCNGKLRVGVPGGYDFVDVRDVAEGICAACERGAPGECYILSGRYASILEILDMLKDITGGKRVLFNIPRFLLKLIAPLCERASLRARTPPFLTSYSVYTMASNALFSHEKATRELGYHPRDLRDTLADMVAWLQREKRVKISFQYSTNN